MSVRTVSQKNLLKINNLIIASTIAGGLALAPASALAQDGGETVAQDDTAEENRITGDPRTYGVRLLQRF